MRISARLILTLLPVAFSAAAVPAAIGQESETLAPAPLLSNEFHAAPFPATPIPTTPMTTGFAAPAGGLHSAQSSGSTLGVRQASAQLGMSPYLPPVQPNDPYAAPPAPGPQYPPGTISGDEAGRLIQGPYSGNWFDFCGPNTRACFNHWYFSADAWFMHRNDATWKNLQVASGTGAVLGRSRDPDFNLETIPRLTFGKAFCDWSLEGSVIYKDDIDAHTDAISANNVNAVFFGLQAAGSDYFQANRMRNNLYDGFHSYEANLINTVSFFQWMVGVRYVEWREMLDVQSIAGTGTSNANIGTYNHMLGGQVGLRAHYDDSIYGYQIDFKTGMYHNDAHIGTVVRDNNNANVIINRQTGGQNEAYLSELSGYASYRPYLWLSLRAGYQFMYINEIALAPDQIIPANNGIATGTAANAHGDMLMHGPTLGAEIVW